MVAFADRFERSPPATARPQANRKPDQRHRGAPLSGDVRRTDLARPVSAMTPFLSVRATTGASEKLDRPPCRIAGAPRRSLPFPCPPIGPIQCLRNSTGVDEGRAMASLRIVEPRASDSGSALPEVDEELHTRLLAYVMAACEPEGTATRAVSALGALPEIERVELSSSPLPPLRSAADVTLGASSHTPRYL